MLFLFYFNRAFGFIVSQAIRAYTWHKYQVYIDVQALQISPLAGRIFFKGLRYHGSNETVIINDGYLTWRYWIRRVKQVDCKSGRITSGSAHSSINGSAGRRSPSGGEQGDANALQDLPCRIHVNVRGVEWFIYNRIPAYESVFASMSATSQPGSNLSTRGSHSARTTYEEVHNAPEQSQQSPSSCEEKSSSFSALWDDVNEKNADATSPRFAINSKHDALENHSDEFCADQANDLPTLLTILPIRVDCDRGAIAMGNENTKSILVARFSSAIGQLDARSARPVDQYKQSIDFDFVHPVVQFKTNENYKETHIAAAAKYRKVGAVNKKKVAQRNILALFRQKERQIMKSLQEFLPSFMNSVQSVPSEPTKHALDELEPTEKVPGMNRWIGLTRYLDEDDGFVEQERWKSIEYGKIPTIVDSPSITMSFFWDVPGKVPSALAVPKPLSPEFSEDINGDVPPEWGLDVRVRGGIINYGPWTDRQRVDLQTYFFPNLFRDSVVAVPLRPGQSRVSTIFKIVVEIEEQTTLRIPTREESRDWRWKERSMPANESKKKRWGKKHSAKFRKGDDNASSPDARPFGWLDITVAADTCISYSMDMFSRANGYHNKLELDLRGPEMTTSVNHGLLWRSKAQSITCDLSNPLQWNALRDWHFDVHSDGFDLFVLRDHIFLLTDLIDDWASGPSGEFLTFVPFKYSMNLQFSDFKIYLNANDSNIIDNPSDIDGNTFIVIWGERLTAHLGIPLTFFQPLSNRITFDADAFHGGFQLRTPSWNTQNTFLDTPEIATLKDLSLDGSYDYFSSTSNSLTDTLVLNVHGLAPTIHLHGFLIRYFMKFKDNYFGEDLHFRTLDEYQAQINKQNASGNLATDEVSHARISNDLDVVLSLTTDNACAMLPCNLYSAAENIKIDISSIGLDLRFTNYYMEIEVSFSPLALSRAIPESKQIFAEASEMSAQVFVDSVSIYGHRLFGLPPAEPTYVCNWDFNIGAIIGECSSDFLHSLVLALKCFPFSFEDAENALPPLVSFIVHDVTFLRAKLESVRIWLHVVHAAFLLSTDKITMGFNDWAGALFSERLHLVIPNLNFAAVDNMTLPRHHSKTALALGVPTHGHVQTTIDLRIVEQKYQFSKDRHLQQDHIAMHDTRTKRTIWLLHNSDALNSAISPEQRAKIKSAAMPFPSMPEPVFNNNKLGSGRLSSSSSTTSSTSSPRVSQNPSSFLSLPSSKQSRRARTARPSALAAQSLNLVTTYDDARQSNTSTQHPIVQIKTSRSASFKFSSRQSLTQNTKEEYRGDNPHLPFQTVTLSSSYETPYFPLQFIQLDLHDVPDLPDSVGFNDDNVELNPGEANLAQAMDDNAIHTNLILDLSSGLRSYCTPPALHHFNELLRDLQPKDVVPIIDELQIKSMTEVLTQGRRNTQVGRYTRVRLGVPFLHLRFASSVATGSKGTERQSYDLSASKIAVNFELALKALDRPLADAEEQKSIHLTLEKIRLSAEGWSEGSPTNGATIHAGLQDLVFWAVSGESVTGDFQARELEVVSAKRKVESLATLLSSTTFMLESIVKEFQVTSNEQSARVRFILFSLMTSDESLADPPFLTGASYVLRSATNHPRITDTWKMVSRLRFIQQSLPNYLQLQLAEQGVQGPITCPANSCEQVIRSFSQWRSWDLADIAKSPLMQTVFGTSSASTKMSLSNYPRVKTSATIASIRLIIDPGYNQNQFVVDTLFIGTALNQPPPDGKTVIHPRAKSSVIEMVCQKTTTYLNWELCELVEDALQQFKQSSSNEVREVVTSSSSPTLWKNHNLHVVVATEIIVVSLNIINLKAISIIHGLKSSLILSYPKSKPQKPVVNVAVHADSITSELISRSKVLTISKLRHPSIYIDIEYAVREDHEISTWKSAASCKQLSIDVREDLPGLFEVADLVLGDEIAYFLRLAKSLPKGDAVNVTKSVSSSPYQSNHIYVALFLESYKIGVAFSPSLVYSVAGRVARSSIRAKQAYAAEMVVDFDVKEHSHSFLSRQDGKAQEISSLPLPAINGHIAVGTTEANTMITIYTTVESIVFNAAALHGLIKTINQSEISNLKDSISRDIDAIKAHYRSILETVDPGSVSITNPPARYILYSARFLAAGLKVDATTPESSGVSTQLFFDLGCLALSMSNKRSGSSQALSFPEIDVGLQDISIVLRYSNSITSRSCGEMYLAISFKGTSDYNDAGELVRSYQIQSSRLEVNLFTETASQIVAILGHLQDEFKDLSLSEEIRSFRRMRRLRAKSEIVPHDILNAEASVNEDGVSTGLFSSMYSLAMIDIQVSWHIGDLMPMSPGRDAQDLVLSFTKIDLATRKENAARLIVDNFQVQMVPKAESKKNRSFNSALLPEVVFNVAYLSTSKDRRFAFQAAGKSLDLRLTSQFILPASDLQHSIALATQELRKAIADWNTSLPQSGSHTKTLMSNKTLASLLVDADFAGAVVYIQGRKVLDSEPVLVNALRTGRIPQHGRYGQFTHEDASSNITLRSPGIALKLEYKDSGLEDPSLNAEIKVNASSNILFPTVVPLVLEMSSSVKEIVGESEETQQSSASRSSPRKFLDEGSLTATDPNAILGSCRLNLGLRICQQKFSLSCQPIARVAATAQFDDIYITVNTVQSADHGRFFALSATFTRPQASIQHVYSRDSTADFEIENIVLSLINSKHVSASKGLSAILKVSPMKAQINAKQLQDFLLFREIWIPLDMRHSSRSARASDSEPQAFVVQRYQQVAAAGAFPLNTTVSIAALEVQLDLGQALGKSTFIVNDFWISSKKTSDKEQNLCLGFDKVGVNSTGRMSGFIELKTFRVRTSIHWLAHDEAQARSPLIQASLGFDHLRIKAALDYQAFFVADITSFEFLMYNVRDARHSSGDRLVSILDSDKVQAFCTTTSAAQIIALYQAFQRLIQEKVVAYEASLRDIEKYLRRKSTATPFAARPPATEEPKSNIQAAKTPIHLHTDVVLTLKVINVGAFPSTFFDNQIFKLEALNTAARFAVVLDGQSVHSSLGLRLGQLRIALSGVTRPNVPKTLGEVSVDDVVNLATSSQGGTILKVPRVVATMETWQVLESSHIDYIFRSSFEGKVDVGWNYSRISFIRGMWTSHSRALAHRLGRPLPQSAVQITGGTPREAKEEVRGLPQGGQEKITAVVNVPQSKYSYTALEPAIIETPQLRDMGEATPPLEWIGLNRDKLPNLTHQIVIVTLLEVAKEVEDAYARILGSS